MVYIRKTNKGTFSSLQMRTALEMIERGRSIRQAAKENKLPSSTVSDYWSKTKRHTGPFQCQPNYELRRVFTEQQENALEEYFMCAKKVHAMVFSDCRVLAYKMAKDNNIRIPMGWRSAERAGAEWLRGFKRRHPALSLTPPPGVRLRRPSSFKADALKVFYEKLQEEMAKETDRAKTVKRKRYESISIKEEITSNRDKSMENVLGLLSEPIADTSPLQLMDVKKEHDIDVSELLLDLQGDPLDIHQNFPEDDIDQNTDGEQDIHDLNCNGDDETLKMKICANSILNKRRKRSKHNACPTSRRKSKRKLSEKTGDCEVMTKSKRVDSKNEDLLQKIEEALRNASPVQKDEFTIYGEHIASKLRNMDKRSCLVVQNKFNNILFETEMEGLDNKG